MPLVPTGEIVDTAAAAGRGAGAFNVIQLEFAEAIVAGAERADRPVLLQVSQNVARYHGALAPIMLATLAVARAAVVPVAVHLDHATDPAVVSEAVALGVSSVMFDASQLPYAGNVAATAAVVARCHAAGVWVEAQLGDIGGKDGAHTSGTHTDPAVAANFVAATGVDALAVAVGTSHAMLTRQAKPDLTLIGRLRALVPVPLVLHGSSGVSDADLAAAVAAGMTKVNIATHLSKAFTKAVRDFLSEDPGVVDTRRYLGPAREAVASEVAHLFTVLGPSGAISRD